ncbi:pantetheine-phosphate adenylyltransferase [Candidatus Bathyarchaeota archaeon]|nr:MAG: pantetheine-phosphate adenylyltransferase [Candidatus Bathyarchaeota archaeon]
MKVLYPGTFDPVTNGHIDIIKRAQKLFDWENVIVGISMNSDKQTVFDSVEREGLIARCFDNIKIHAYEGLTVNYCKNYGIDAIIRGVRNQLDFEYEFPMAAVNRDMSGIETVLVMANPAISVVSSSMVKAIVKNRGLVYKFVPKHVQEALEERLSYE